MDAWAETEAEFILLKEARARGEDVRRELADARKDILARRLQHGATHI